MDSINNLLNISADKNNKTEQIAETSDYKGKKTKKVSSETRTSITNTSDRLSTKLTERKTHKVSVKKFDKSNVKVSKQAVKNIDSIEKITSAIENHKKFHEQDEHSKKVIEKSLLSSNTKDLLTRLQKNLEEYKNQGNLSKDFDKTTKASINAILDSISQDLQLTNFSTKNLIEFRYDCAKESKKLQKKIETSYTSHNVSKDHSKIFEDTQKKDYFESKKNLYNEIIKFRKEIPKEIKKLDKQIAKLSKSSDIFQNKELSNLIDKRNNLKNIDVAAQR